MIYACAVTFTKLSIVFFYRRIFGTTWGLMACIFLIISYWVTVMVTAIAACQPIDYFWVGVCTTYDYIKRLLMKYNRLNTRPQEQLATVLMCHSFFLPTESGYE